MRPPIILARGKHTFLVKRFEGTLHTHDGIIDLKSIKDKNFGDEVETHLGVKYKILPYRAVDFFKHFKRSTTPIMPKDIGAIIAYTGLSPDSLILDAGTGTGMLCAYLAYFNKYGEVVTVEKRKDFAKIARENFKLAGLKNIHQIIGDVNVVSEGFKSEFDLIVLDMKDDVRFIPKAMEILRYGGHLVVYNPYIEDTRAVYEKMVKVGFKNVESFEIVKIDYEHKRIGTRPMTRIWHTGFLVMGRKF